MTTPSTEQLVRAYFTAVNEEIIEDIESVFAENAVGSFPGARPRIGRGRIAAFLSPEQVFKPWTTHIDTPLWIMVDGSRAVAGVRFTGVSKAGVACEFDAVDVFRIENGAIAELTTYFDPDAMRKALSPSQ